MAEVRVTVEDVVRTGLIATYNGSLSTSNTYLVNNDGKTILHFKKSEAVDCVVTIQTPGTVDGLAIAERTVTIPATTGDKFIGPFPPAVYNDTVHDLRFTLSNIAGVTVAALRCA